MGWESRARGGRYYTRSRRENGRVIREYVGGGQKGEQAAAEDAARRAERAAEHALMRAERDRVQAIDAELVSLHNAVELMTRGALLAAGYERRKRQWRRRHDDPSEVTAGHP